jgi:arabinofuranosyltransferase
MNRLAFVLSSATLLLFFVAYQNFRLDDSFIFYQYAKNIATGNGYVFNLGEKVNATTSPLYTLILAFLYFIVKPFYNDSVVLLGNLISIISIVLILYYLKKIIGEDKKSQWFVMIFLAIPLLKFGFGMETFLNLALIICSVYFFTNQKYYLSAFYSALSILARMDSVLFAVILLLFYIYKKHEFPNLKVITVFFSTLAPWFVFSILYFNSLLPSTIGIKLSQKDLELFGAGYVFLTNSVRVIPGTYLSVTSILASTTISIFFLWKKRINIFQNSGIAIIILWSTTLFIIYAFIINAMPYQWYYTPFALPLSIVFAWVITYIQINNSLKKIIIILFFVIALILPIKNLIEGYNPKYINFTKAANWLNENASYGSLLGTDDIGILGFYYSKGKIVDGLGLVTPEVSYHLLKKDFNWYINHYQPDFIVNEYPNIQPYISGDEKVFRINYKTVKVIKTRGEQIAIYMKKQ